MNDELANRAAVVDAQGRAAFGESTWTTLCTAMTRQNVSPQVLAPVVVRGDAVERLAEIGQQAALTEMQNGRPSDPFYKECEAAYTIVRNEQRALYAKLKTCRLHGTTIRAISGICTPVGTRPPTSCAPRAARQRCQFLNSLYTP
jgi:hypothetical protein